MIQFFIKGQKLELQSPFIAGDTIRYLEANFNFLTSDWQGKSKIAVFEAPDGTAYSFILDEDKITADKHLDLTNGKWKVGVVGTTTDGIRITTNCVELVVEKNCQTKGEVLPPIPPNMAEEILAKAEKAVATAQSVRDDADAGKFNGKNGADGKPGKDGKPGTNGVDGVSPTANTRKVDGITYLTVKDGTGVTESEILDGAKGAEGMSAYEVAVKNGYKGTETEWLESLRGAIEAATTVKLGGVYANPAGAEDTVNVTIDESGFLKTNNKAIKQELNRPHHTTLIVTAMTEGIGFKADYTAKEIKTHADGGGVVILRFNAPDRSGEQSYPYETFKNGVAVFRRLLIDKAARRIARINITIDNKRNIVKTEEEIFINEVDSALNTISDNPVQNKIVAEAIQHLEDDKAEYKIKVIAQDKVTQADAREILTFYDQYDGKLIEFLTNGDLPNKAVATGRLMTDKSNNMYLITYNRDGTITQWSKDGFEKHTPESFSYPIPKTIDIDNLTIDVEGNPPFECTVNDAFNKPPKTGNFGVVSVKAYNVGLQIQEYTDIETGKKYQRLVTGQPDKHSFSTWSSSSASGLTIDSAMSDNSENAVQNKVIKKYTDTGLNEKLSKTDISEWAKQPTKPTYTAEEVGALPKGTKLFDGDYNNLNNKPTIPTKTSELANDNGYLTEHQLVDYAKKSEIPTATSQLQNDSGFLTEHQSLKEYAKKSDLTPKADKTYVNEQLATKQPKGDYLLQTDLQSGIDTALAQAKASGEFNGKDGANGKDGKTPVKGVDYFTTADKQEITQSVLNSLPTWQGGSY